MARYIFGTSNFHIYNQNRPWKLQYFYIVLEIEMCIRDRTYATFNSDGTYNGRGYFGNGSGTYKISGNTIICYIEGEEYLSNVYSIGITRIESNSSQVFFLFIVSITPGTYAVNNGLVEQLDSGAFYMTDIELMIGQS